MVAAICSRASEPQHGSLCPARMSPATMPLTMAAEELPSPRANGILESMVYLHERSEC